MSASRDSLPGETRRTPARMIGSSWMSSGVLPACLAILLCLQAASAWAQPSTDLIWSFQANGNLQAITAIPDIDGDGGPDIVFEGYENGPSDVDHVFAIRGASSGSGRCSGRRARSAGRAAAAGRATTACVSGTDLNGDGTRSCSSARLGEVAPRSRSTE